MAIKTVIGKIIYNILGKHMPPSDSRFSFGSKHIRAFCGKLILKECGKNVNIEKGAHFSSEMSLGDYSGIGINAQLAPYVSIVKYSKSRYGSYRYPHVEAAIYCPQTDCDRGRCMDRFQGDYPSGSSCGKRKRDRGGIGSDKKY